VPERPFPRGGQDGEEHEDSWPSPADRNGPEPGNRSPADERDSGAGLFAADTGESGDAAAAERPIQGLFVSLPAEQADVSGFADGSGTVPIAPGPLLASLAHAVAECDGVGLARVSEDCLFSVLSAGRRMSSWGTWLELAAMHELAVRHPATPDQTSRQKRAAGIPEAPASDQSAGKEEPAAPKQGAAAGTAAAGTAPGPAAPAADGRIQFSEFVADEVAADLRLTWMSAADRISYACDLAGRLPVTFAAMGAGLIDPVHARIIAEQTDILSAADAARADPVLAAAAQAKTYGELRATAAKLVLKLDPDSYERRKQANRREAHVRPFREESGNAGMSARELPSDEVLASWQHVEQRALDLRAAGVTGTLRELRIRAYLDLLQERDSRLVAGLAPDQKHGPADETGGNGPSDAPDGPAGPDGNGGPRNGSGGNGGSGPRPDSPAGTGPDGRARPAAKDPGPCLAALVNITVPLATLLGLSGTPGEAGGFGILDAGTARDLIAAAGRSPHTRWCVTALHPDGTAAAHGCAPGRHPPPPGPEPPGSEPPGTTALGTSGGPDQRPLPDTRVRDYLRSLQVRLTPVARGSCDHRHAETGYQPSRKLQHLIRTRNTRCTAPGCGRPAARCDLDHTIAWDKGGITCECGLAPLCRHHHRCKQAQGWQLTQPEPGVLVWRTPHRRTFTTTPTEYPV